MTIDVYMLSLMLSANGTAQFLVAFSIVCLVWEAAIHVLTADARGKITLPKPNRIMLLVLVLLLTAATILPDRKGLITATAVVRGPEIAKELIEMLGTND